MTSDRRIGFVRQAQLAQPGAPIPGARDFIRGASIGRKSASVRSTSSSVRSVVIASPIQRRGPSRES